ncbi:MAG TPA: hypothetical protein VJC07_01760 [Candidatus Nanoarchaeia archaeon]|nr:hypothetical protein [Candidatus Nanoarchaeia archaeon]
MISTAGMELGLNEIYQSFDILVAEMNKSVSTRKIEYNSFSIEDKEKILAWLSSFRARSTESLRRLREEFRNFRTIVSNLDDFMYNLKADEETKRRIMNEIHTFLQKINDN